MLSLLQMRCLRCKKKIIIGFVLATSLLSVWLQFSMVAYRIENVTVRVASSTNLSVASSSSITMRPEWPTEQRKLRVSKQFVQERYNHVRPTMSLSDEIDTSPLEEPIVRLADPATRQLQINLPGLQTYLPHLRRKPEYLTPAVKISRNRTGVQLVIGIPTVQRQIDGYLSNTLDSILSALPHNNSLQCLIIVFIAEPWNKSFVTNLTSFLQEQYSAQINSGLLDIIAPKSEFYPNLSTLPLTLSDNEDRVRWRTKQNLDYVYLMLHAYTRGKYYIQLEDDIITKPGFFQFIMANVVLRDNNWLVLKFSPLGFIGKLFRATDLPFIAEFLLMFYSDKPGDWLLDNLMSTKVCGRNMAWKDCLALINKIAIEVRPSQFQHIGYHSSLKGKVQVLKDKTFNLNPNNALRKDDLPKKSLNPTPTSIETTIKEYKNYKIEYAYAGTGLFWGQTPVSDDVIDFMYEPPVKIERYKLVSGAYNNLQDVFPSITTVEVFVSNVTAAPQEQEISRIRKFQVVGHFNNIGVAEASLPANIGHIGVFRIHVNSNMTTWVVLSNISITLGMED